MRGIRSGLPVNECLRIVATEAPEPVRGQFKGLIDVMGLGLTLEQGLRRVYAILPLPDINFFIVVLTIQQETGGNLSESLGNLSAVLRERKRLRGKIVSLSQEAKTSAIVLSLMAPAIALAILFISPDYLAPLFETFRGQVLLAFAGFWMGVGVLIIRKMIDLKDLMRI